MSVHIAFNHKSVEVQMIDSTSNPRESAKKLL
jgi:hypothetical protein